MVRWVSTALLMCAATGSYAETASQKASIEEQIKSCRLVVDVTARLKCFDQIAPAASDKPSSKGAWQTEKEVSNLDLKQIVTVSLYAETASAGRSQGQEAALLAIKCAENVTSAYVVHSSFSSNTAAPTPVQYRIGINPPKNASWNGSQDNKAYGLWHSQQAVPFVKELISASDFFVRGNARVFGTTEALFKLAGLEEAIKPVREACKW